MRNKDDEIKKIVIGVVVGGIVGGSAFYLWNAIHGPDRPVLNKIGRAIAEMGDILENSAVDDRGDAIDRIEKSLPKGENTINHVLNWVATGINLWNKVKKGN
ncbi:MAG: hypothetical protein WCF19_06035 [Chlamydiales bacterium]